MRVTKEKAAQNRERILTEAARLFRERGVSAVGMDALAEATGMTHGSLYSQFHSKEHLATEALGRAFDASAAKYGEVETLSNVCRTLSVTAPSGHSGKRLCHCDAWLRGPSPGQCDAADLYRGTSTYDGEIDALVGSKGSPKKRERGFGDRCNTGRRHDSGSRRRRSGVVRSDTGSVPRAIKPDLRLDSRRLKDHPRGVGIEWP